MGGLLEGVAMFEEHSNGYQKARTVFLCCLIIFIVIEICIFLYFGAKMNQYSENVTKDLNLTENVASDSSVKVYPEYDETAEWDAAVESAAKILGVNTEDANDILHQIAAIYKQQFGTQFYFFNEFELIDNTDNHYSISSGDDYARFEVQIKDGVVTWVQELEFKNIK